MLSQGSDQDNSFIGRENPNELDSQSESSTRNKSKTFFYFSNFT